MGVKQEVKEARASADQIAFGVLASLADLDPVESVCALAIAQSFLIPVIGGEGVVSHATMERVRPDIQGRLLDFVTELCQEARESTAN